MTSPFFGFIFNENLSDPTTPVLSDFAIVGLVLPSDDANPTVFPLNVPVSGNSGDTTFLSAIGTGPLYRAIERINANLGDLQVSAQVVIVRVATAKNSDGTENVAGTIANIVGDPASRTGLYALLSAPQACNVTPRLIGAPGYTGIITNAVAALTLANPGHDYSAPIVTFNPPGAAATATIGNAGVQATAHAVLTAGAVSNIVLDSGGQDYADGAPSVTLAGGGGTGATAHAVLNATGAVDHIAIDATGSGYTSAPSVTIGAPAPGEITALTLTSPGSYPLGTVVTATISDPGGNGGGATASLTLELLGNPICAALPAVLNSLLAHALVGGPGTTKAEAMAWRGTLNHPRLIPQDDWEIVAAPVAGTAYIDGAARSLGLAVRTDFQHGGYPFFSWANQPVQGALGLKRVDSFSLIDGATDGQELLAAGIGITVRGDLSDTSLDESGFIAVSVNNASSIATGNFYNKTRGRDFIDLALLKTIRVILGKQNITPHSVQSVLNAMAVVMVDLQSRECVVGYTIGFKAADNSIAGLRAGKFTVYDNSEEPAPICQITINRALDEAALTSELATLAATGTSVTG